MLCCITVTGLYCSIPAYTLIIILRKERMEDPQDQMHDESETSNDSYDETAAEEEMEKMLLAQEGEVGDVDEIDNNGNVNGNNNDPRFEQQDENEDNLFFEDETIHDDINFPQQSEKKNPFTYVRVSFWSALFLIYYAFRSRQQFYLALVFLSSSKWAYVVLGNALVASLIWSFQVATSLALNGLRLTEAEGLSDFFRWHITEACLALTIFRSELNVKTGILFLVLVFAKCLHWVVDMRESHLRMTEEVIIVNPNTGWIAFRWPHMKLLASILSLAVFDIVAVVMCGQSIMNNGPSVNMFFAFETAIMLTSVISNSLLWYLHMLDGIFHYLHERYDENSMMHHWLHPWKDHKATLIFAVELQAQAAKFVFYLTFFAVVMTYYGLPVNLIREVYMSFHSLKTRLMAFNKYRKLMSSMNRFSNPTAEELEEERICIICRDEMTVETSKRLPGCGHIFHKSCLREWLVQQQTCPTCRGDIAANESRQKAQNILNAIAQQRQQQQDREQDQQETTEGETQEEESKMATTTNVAENTTTNNITPISPEIQTSAVSEIVSVFPAFYRVTKGTGTPVFNYIDKVSTGKNRVVPFGVVVLGQEMDYRKCNEENHMMLKIPDGWVNDNDVERIIAVPFQ